MKDLNLGPDSRRLAERYRATNPMDHAQLMQNATEMVSMLERWMESEWCWVDAGPARICGGPHVKVRYEFDKSVDVIEPASNVGSTFKGAEYVVIS